MTHMEKLKQTLTEIGVVYEMTDDSEESEIDDDVDTVVMVGEEEQGAHALFFFYADGSYKDFCVM